MAGFFQKVLWVECIGEGNQKCPKFLNKERIPAYKNRCTECGGKVRQIVKPNAARLAIATALAVLLVAGGLWAAEPGLFSGVFHFRLPARSDRDNPAPKPRANPAIQWKLVTDKDGSRRTLSPDRDFRADGDTYRTNEAFHAGDRLRLQVSYPADRLYVFYRSGDHAERLVVDTTGQVSIPSSEKWFQLNNDPGTEEFILIASSRAVPELDEMSGTFDPVALDNQIRRAQGTKDPALVRVQVRHE